MTVREIIKLVCEFVGEKEISIKFRDSQALTAKEKEKVDIMLNCFNLVNQEIASDYIPYMTKEEILVENSILNFQDLQRVPIHIYEVRSRFGFNLKFKLYPEYLEIFGKAKTIVYSYLPSDVSDLEAEVFLANGLSARVLAYGIASEFLLVEGLSEDAEIWEDRFKRSLFMLSRRKGEHIMPRRRWA